jgi:hypothetical protein
LSLLAICPAAFPLLDQDQDQDQGPVQKMATRPIFGWRTARVPTAAIARPAAPLRFHEIRCIFANITERMAYLVLRNTREPYSYRTAAIRGGDAPSSANVTLSSFQTVA